MRLPLIYTLALLFLLNISSYVYYPISSRAFNPEVLHGFFMNSFATQIIEVLAIHVGFYAMHTYSPIYTYYQRVAYQIVGLAE